MVVRGKARALRSNGYTHREIKKELGISLASAHAWTRGIKITDEQKRAIQQRYNKKVFTKKRRGQLRQLALKNLVPLLGKHTKGSLLNRIKIFYEKNGRIPLKREFGDPKVYRMHFGTWNNAIIEAGFDPNPVLFSKKFFAKDGHLCDSFTEKIIDDWLCEKGIEHQRNFKYGATKMTADFLIEKNIVLEFFGLAGVQKTYDEIVARKKKFCREARLKLVEVYPGDIYPVNRLAELLQLVRE